MQKIFENLLITHCAPTLARMKTANLFSCALPHCHLAKCVETANQTLTAYGVRTLNIATCPRSGRYLLYVYRESMLKKDLAGTGVPEFLCPFGYPKAGTPSCMLEILSERLCLQLSFPHEIGLFLGYPLHDVQGFVINQGRNSCLNGFWKVYSQPDRAKKLFSEYKKCTEEYKLLYQNGKTIPQLTVAA